MESQEITLIRQAQSGDVKSFEALVAMHDRAVYNTALHILGNHNDAQDVYQECFLKVFEKITLFRFESQFKTWLLRIVVNLSINVKRRRKIINWISIFDKNKEETELEQIIPGIENTDTQILNKELSIQIQKGLDLLSPRERAVFTFKQYQGYKVKEIADVLNCAEGTVKNYLFRATTKMKKYLTPYYLG